MKLMTSVSISLIAVSLTSSAWSHGTDDPLLRPIEPKSSARWLQAQPPTRIFGNTWLVGFGGLNVALIQTSRGLILIDGAVPQAVPAIEENIRSLGFDLTDIKLIFSTEPHFDHAGGLAALARDTGATIVASAAAVQVLRQGRSGPDDPQAAWLASFPPVEKVRVVRDGEGVRLGNTIVTARATPGHTFGSMSWTWRSCEAKRCAATVFAASLNPVAADGYKFSDPEHAAIVAAFRRTFATVRALPCDILLSAHPNQSGGEVKFARLLQRRSPNPFIDTEACRAYANKHEQLLEVRLAEEAKPPKR